MTADAKFWCVVKGTLPGIGVKLQITARDFGIAPLTELNGKNVFSWQCSYTLTNIFNANCFIPVFIWRLNTQFISFPVERCN